MATVSKFQKLADINHKNDRFTNMPKLIHIVINNKKKLFIQILIN
jgi:hypothetical protein